MARRNWTRAELLVALKLYCELEFRQFHSRQPRIVEVAQAINRTPSALSMKLCNFASLDPAVEGKGLTGASNADKEIMEIFLDSPAEVVFEAEAEFGRLDLSGDLKGFSEPDQEFIYDFESYKKTEKLSLAKVRTLQGFFRKTVIASYNFNCAICGIDIPELLIASHIVPWAADESRRILPTNGISLCASHDKAFDKGFLAVNDDYTIILSSKLNDYSGNHFSKLLFFNFEGHMINKPFRFLPDQDCLKWHRENVFCN